MSADFYDLLEVSEDASQDDIRDAFREKVRIYHPDHNDDPRASAQFTAVKKAYDTLGDPVERNAYDRMGHIDYVNKRLDGLPDPEKWAPSGLEDDGSTSSSVSSGGTSSSSASSGAASGTSSGTTSSTASGGYSGGGRSTGSSTGTSTGSSRGSNATRSSTTGGSTGASTSTSGGVSTGTTSGATTSSSTGTSSRSGSSGSNRRAASDGAGTARRSAADYEIDPVVAWISRHRFAQAIVGWKLLWAVFALYALGLAAFARLEQGSVTALGERLLEAGTDAAALASALDREGVPVVAEATIRPLVSGGDPGTIALASAALLLAGALLLPAAVGLLVYVTRTSPGWKPNYLYVVATLAPLAGIVAGLAATPPLTAELALFVVLPIGALFVMVLSAFVRPRVLIFLQNARS